MSNKIIVAGVALVAFLLWMNLRSSVMPAKGSATVKHALSSIQKPYKFPAKVGSVPDADYIETSNEIIRAYIKEKQEKKEVAWSNIWTRAETPPGNEAVFKELSNLSMNGYSNEVKSLCLRVAHNTNFPNSYRARALNGYLYHNDLKLEDASIPLLITLIYGVTNSSSQATMIRPFIPPEQWARFIPYMESLPADAYNKKAISDDLEHIKRNLARMNEEPFNP